MGKIKLLLVDDEQLIRESLQIVLNLEEDMEVVGIAGNGQEAIEQCEKLQPNFVLMDVNMPVLNGVEAARVIKEKRPHTKIIMLTTFQEVEHVLQAMTAGAEGYLLKAIPPKELADGIRIVHLGGTLIPQRLAKKLFEPKSSKLVTQHIGPTNELTPREEEILSLIADGLTNKGIAEKLFLSEGTVKNYISSIYSKLEVSTRTEASKKAREEGIV